MRSLTIIFWLAAASCYGWGQAVSSALPAEPVAAPTYADIRSIAARFAPHDGRSAYAAFVPATEILNLADDDSLQLTDSSTQYKASSYIPLDSWLYPAFDRLAGLGYLPSSTSIIRPWTRLEGARLVAEAHKQVFETDEIGETLLASLDREFADETRIVAGAKNHQAQVDSAYTRFTAIAGTPLRDGYHFAQTLVDDFGRPYGKGANEVSGLAVRADAGPLAFYFRGEHQYASELPTSIYSVPTQQALALGDSLPFGWNLRFGDTDRVRPIEVYAALNLHDWQLTFGQQSLWWGPARSTSLILSTNAAPLPMLRLDRVSPAYMPGPLRIFGPVHFEMFMARQGGIHFVRLGLPSVLVGNQNTALTPPPYLWGINFTFKPTQNFELGLAHTTIFAGYGRPLTFGTFFHTLSILGDIQAVDPGKRVTEVNLNYHVPGFRRALQVYSEGMAWDNPVEGKFVARFAWDPGVYLTELPKLHNMDARLEAVYTDLPKLAEQGYYYANAHYTEGYTNYGQILGSWVGRQGIGGQASTTYWFSPQKKAGFFYRKMVSDVSLSGGGSSADYGVTVSWRVKPQIELNAMGQYENWKFTALQPTSRSNFTSSFEFRVYPNIGTHSR